MNDKLISEFLHLGCPDEKQAFIVLQVYLEICEVKRYWDVEYRFNQTLKRMYITAKKTKDGPVNIFLPFSANEEVSFLKIQKLITGLESQQKSAYLVFVSSDSTCVYYQITDGLEEPTDVSAKHLRENKQEKLDADLRKNKTLLEQSALYGIPITITKEASGDKTKT